MSTPGATKALDPGARARQNTGRAESLFLPNFCDPGMVLAVVLVSELLAVTFSLVRPEGAGFLIELARISVLMQWLGLTSAALLCAMRDVLRNATTAATTGLVLATVLGNVLVLSLAIVWAGRSLGAGERLDMFPESALPFIARNLGVGLVVTSLLLRYCFVSHQWRRHVESEARTRINALQARIRPHFLFNSMNTIASLTRSDPRRAEEAVEDLAELFRASLGSSARRLRLEDEIALTRNYERIERLRLGDRLDIHWALDDLPLNARLPALTIQPLLENAILHGIEPLEGGGVVEISGRRNGHEVEISVCNPIGSARAAGAAQRGQGIATENVRERLRLAFAGRASLSVSQTEAQYRATLRFPVEE